MTQVWTFKEARDAARAASQGQKNAEDFMREAYRSYADKERLYRLALAETIITLHSEGIAWTVCQDVARGNEKVARLRMERDIAEGVKEAAQQAAWRRSADRKDTRDLLTWSMRRELAEGYGTVPADDDLPVIGAKA